MVSALLSGGSSPGGAEIPEDAIDPVTVDSCFCVGIIRMVHSREPEQSSAQIAPEHVCLYAP